MKEKCYRYRLLLYAFLVILLCRISLIEAVFSDFANSYYVTYEGIVIKTEIDNRKLILFINDQEQIFTLSGSLTLELEEVSYRKIIITGKIVESSIPQVLGDIYVETYRFNEIFDKVGWIIGTVYESNGDIVIVGEDQSIYTVTTPNIFRRLKNTKIITALGIGDRTNDFYINVYDVGCLIKVLEIE